MMTLQGHSKYLDKYDGQVVNSGSSFESLRDLPSITGLIQQTSINSTMP